MMTTYGNSPKLYIDDENVLRGQLGLKKIRGQITSTIYGNLSGNQVNEGDIEIDGVRYSVDDDLIQNFLSLNSFLQLNKTTKINVTAAKNNVVI